MATPIPPLGPTRTPAPIPVSPSSPQQPTDLEDLFTLIGSGISIIALLFTLVLYLHYRHLHSYSNHTFMSVLVVDLIAAIAYFSCVFMPNDVRRTTEHCEACGFVEQIYSMAEPCLMTLFWVNVYFLCSDGNDLNCMLFGFRRQWQPFLIAGIMVVSVLTAVWALAGKMYSADGQAWCWIGQDHTWFRVIFCWMWVAIGMVVMIVSLIKPLTSSFLNETQKRLLIRRGMLVLAWFLVNIVNVIGRYMDDRTWLSFQALVNPLTGLLNVLAFLYSERMMTIRALGLPPGAEPTYGFTAAMRYIPDKLRPDRQQLL